MGLLWCEWEVPSLLSRSHIALNSGSLVGAKGREERYWRQGRECWGVDGGRERRDASQRVTVGDDDDDDDDDYWRPRYGLGVARLVSGRRIDLKRRFSERERISPSPTLVPLSRVLRAVENFSS